MRLEKILKVEGAEGLFIKCGEARLYFTPEAFYSSGLDAVKKGDNIKITLEDSELKPDDKGEYHLFSAGSDALMLEKVWKEESYSRDYFAKGAPMLSTGIHYFAMMKSCAETLNEMLREIVSPEFDLKLEITEQEYKELTRLAPAAIVKVNFSKA